MTGREQKVYYSYSQISHKHNIPDDSPQQPLGKDAKPQGFALPELEHNLQLLIDITEQEIIQSDRQLQYERDMVVNLTHEIQKMSEVLSHEETAISNLSKVLDMVEECERRMQPNCENPLTLDECAKIFETLQDKYYEEYRMSDRVDLAVAIVYPLMKDYFKNWDPLKVCVSLIYLQFLFDGLSFISTFPCFFLSTLERKKKKKRDRAPSSHLAGEKKAPENAPSVHVRVRSMCRKMDPPCTRTQTLPRAQGQCCVE